MRPLVLLNVVIGRPMSEWDTIKAQVIPLKQTLDERTTDGTLSTAITTMNGFIENYTKNAGMSQNPSSNADYNAANQIFNTIQLYEFLYIHINKILAQHIQSMTGSNDIRNKLRNIGVLQQSIVKLEKDLEDVTQDVDTSLTRQSVVEHPREELSWYQGFGGKLGFTKPIHQTSVAFMIGFGLLLLFLSTLILREFFIPAQGTVEAVAGEGGIFSVFTDSRFISTVSGVLFVMIVLLVLTFKGYVGKNPR
jgi:hypothetical protein